jgi:methionyl-tRNA formyltransferase
MTVLFIGKASDSFAEDAANFIQTVFSKTKIVMGKRGDKFPKELYDFKCDYIFSYLSQWIIPEEVLNNAKYGGINWHPGPPEYPGIGCTNFAIYNNENVFGITCHFMNPKVDTGNIIEVRRFNVLQNDTVFSITQKCYQEIRTSFNSIVKSIASSSDIPTSSEFWTRKPYTRKELNELCRITPDMSKNEVEKRIKATTYHNPWAYIELHGLKFKYINPNS